MSRFFLFIYDIFRRKRIALYSSLAFLFFVFIWFAGKMSYEEDIMRFIPGNEETKNVKSVFQNLKVKDKLIVMFSDASNDKERLIPVADSFASDLSQQCCPSLASHISSDMAESQMTSFTALIYDNLPLFVDSMAYAKLDTLLTPEGMHKQFEADYYALMMPSSMFTKDFIMKDPLGIGTPQLQKLQNLKLDGDYEVIDNHLFTSDGHLLVFIDPAFPASNTAENGKLVDIIEKLVNDYQVNNKGVTVDYFGGPAISVYNARQIKQDMKMTLGVASLIIILVVFLSFRNKFSILLLFVPVVFGALFSLALLYFIKGSISIIAIGSGSAVLGVVISYSIHVIAHREHTKDIRQLIAEMSAPLTIGSFTTIGAFFSLVFTDSEVLQDFGWFSSLTIIGTTLFCLIYLPHILDLCTSVYTDSKPTPFLQFIEKINGFHFERCKWLVALILIASVGGLLVSNRVSFDADMNKLGYSPDKFKHSEQILVNAFSKDSKNIYFVAVGNTQTEAINNYRQMNIRLAQLSHKGEINQYATAQSLLLTPEEQYQRIDKWKTYWTDERIATLRKLMLANSAEFSFSAEVTDNFIASLKKNYTPIDYSKCEALRDFITDENGLAMVMTQVNLKEVKKPVVYQEFNNSKGVVILDKPHFLSKFMNTISDDFYFVLFVSSFIVFIALLLSYGRLELALITFMPMALSWFIILGIMAVFGLKFNIVSIIISTFIFGTGDDFSIFVTDGLQTEYSTGHKMLASHKTAIFFSAFTTIVGMGALFFAKHPSLLSVAQTSMIGMISVVLIAYTIQPLLFHLFITKRTNQGKAPWSIGRIYAMFCVLGCFTGTGFIIVLLIPFLLILPVSRKTKRWWLHNMVCKACRLTYFMSFGRFERRSEGKVDYDNPSIIISNHQSVLDLLRMMAYSPRIVMVVKRGVWDNMLLGPITRFLGCVCSEAGLDDSLPTIKQMVGEGYSLLIFPEGTRSADGEIIRFHKGPFYMAEKLNMDITPIIMTGTGHGIYKGDLTFLNPGLFTLTVYPRILASDTSWGVTYQERRTSICQWYRKEYAVLLDKYNNTEDRYFANMLCQNYIYKGFDIEWKVRKEVKNESAYKVYDELIPKNATVTDLGCGLGALDYMLTYISPKRKVTAYDDDVDKIDLANCCFAKTDSNQFIAQNLNEVQPQMSDVFIYNDTPETCRTDKGKLLLTCMQNLNEGGLIIVRSVKRVKKSLIERLYEWGTDAVNSSEEVKEQWSREQMSEFSAKYGYTCEFKKSGTTDLYLIRK